ncbi:Nitrate and nitrite sensing [Sinosporangium album]|uniref:histidine kinase n=1 Tax=Sinosporangium album TaxID=504805 RepID=A0A1G7TYT5_9ACTN|nr:nitrate- and nitrite sensing domain-containing protein [Sinosporangium album]SDG40545.1 Nitrate and nitrite sensing [Sinosporangium album]
MLTGGRPIHVKIILLLAVPITSLIALWIFAAGLTGSDGLRLLEINTVVNTVSMPSEQAVIQIQHERLTSVRFLRPGQSPDELHVQRAKTDKAVAEFTRLASGDDAREAVSPETRTQLTTLLRELQRLPEIRRQVDGRNVDSLEVIDFYSGIVDSGFRMYDKMILVPDLHLYRQAKAVTTLGEAKEILSRERALITGAVAAGRVTPSERDAFTRMSATRRFLYGQAISALDAEIRGPYEKLYASSLYNRFAVIENRLRNTGPGESLPPQSILWPAEVTGLWTAVERNQAEAVQHIVVRVTPAAVTILVQIGIAGGVGLIAVVLSVVVTLRFRKRLVGELAGLRDAARELADVKLTALVERLRNSKNATPGPNAAPDAGADIAVPLDVKTDTLEIRGILHAFDSVQKTAVDAAVDQARLRNGVSKVFVNLARRNQSLLHRQLSQLDAMEKATDDPDALQDLFSIDHLTTRMRRHAESLIILSGASPGRGWRNPIPVVDVVRAALAEIEEYARVQVMHTPRVSLAGSAVADTIHLIAELAENATLFSPSQTKVDLRSSVDDTGLLVEIEDRGLGIGPVELYEINTRLTDVPEFDLAESDKLGLFVVARLAARHNIRVALNASPFGGINATVHIPADLIVHPPTAVPALTSAKD